MLKSEQVIPVPLLLFILGLPSLSTAIADLCPPQEDIIPCACVSDSKNIRIDCIGVNSLTDLKRGLQGLRGYKDVSMDLLRCRLPEIPEDLFSGLHITKLSFTECKISEKTQLYFSGLDHSLQDLSVTFSFPEHNGLTFLNVSNLRSLEHLEIEGNYIKKMGNGWFQSPPKKLENLFIMTNDIEELGTDVFSSLLSLKNLWVSGNKFSTIRRSMFPRSATHLVSLDLSNNKISEIPADLFSDMPSLKEVILDENDIKTISESSWSRAWNQLTRVYLNDNPLHCDDSIKWMFARSRPNVIKGKCASPPSMKGKELKQLIDAAQEESD